MIDLKDRFEECPIFYFQLVDFNWSLGMAMSSSNCRNLSSPYVSVVLRIAEPSGKVNTRSFEMTVPEFQVSSLSVWYSLFALKYCVHH